MLNKKSGLLGISGLSNDLRDLEAAAAQGNARAQLGPRRVRLPDAQVHRRLHGQPRARRRARLHRRHRPARRAHARAHLPPAGEHRHLHGLRAQHGARLGRGGGVHPYSPIAILVIPTNEELQIAIDTYALIFGSDGRLRRRRTDFTL